MEKITLFVIAISNTNFLIQIQIFFKDLLLENRLRNLMYDNMKNNTYTKSVLRKRKKKVKFDHKGNEIQRVVSNSNNFGSNFIFHSGLKSRNMNITKLSIDSIGLADSSSGSLFPSLIRGLCNFALLVWPVRTTGLLRQMKMMLFEIE